MVHKKFLTNLLETIGNTVNTILLKGKKFNKININDQLVINI